MHELVYLFLIVAGTPVAHIGTYTNMGLCEDAVTSAQWGTPRAGVIPKRLAVSETAPGVFLCVHAHDKAAPPPKY